jgi:putative ABC transport system permease protein
VHAIFLKPLPYEDPDRLVTLTLSVPEQNFNNIGYSWPRLLAVRERQEVFSSIGAMVGSAFTVTGKGDPEQVQGLHATHDFFTTLGIKPALGRTFLPEEDKAGGEPVVLLSDQYWQQHYNSRPDVLGDTITLDGKQHTIVGVLPKAMSAFPLNQVGLFVPRPYEVAFLTQQQIDDGGFFFNVTARLKPGVTLAQANEAVGVIGAGYAKAFPTHSDTKARSEVVPLIENLVGNQAATYAMLFAAVGCVLLIAIANVANLVLARYAGRRKQIAIRFALGAKRRHVMTEFVAENVMLALIGGLVGLGFAAASLALVTRIGENFIPRAGEVSLDPTVIAFTLAVSLLTGFVLGLIPALQVAKAQLTEALKDSSRDTTGGKKQNRVRTTLLVTEVAVSFVLLIAASLMITSFVRMNDVEPGFRAEGVFRGFIVPPPALYPPRTDQTVAFYKRLFERLKTIPGAKSVALSDNPPLSGNGGQSPYAAVGRPIPPMGEQPVAIRHLISPNRFATLGIPVTRGRDFDERDTPSSPAAVIINEAMAKALFPNEDPVGRKIQSGMAQWQQEIVGVVADTHTTNLTQAPVPEMFYPLFQRPENFTSILIRTEGDPKALEASVRAALKEVDPGIPLTNPGTMEEFVQQSMADRKLTMTLLAAFAGLALLLASLGVYSVMAYNVTQRTGEIGVRMAMGARPADVQKLVVRQGMTLAVLGVLIGVSSALALTRLMGALLFEVKPGDPLTYVGISALLGTVAILACWIPARRAARVDPLVALRSE